ncbi:MAG: SoxR reducing system RseC family protein [Prevotellaceae bacterium]|jgi:sigma-E factor negative regulatory protein RseC|nr:SoxR reducing system RseC family protein [Prevotellaceae bacterium]
MANTSFIKHRGIVERISSGSITVRIQVTEACAACHAKGFCSISGIAEKRMEIPNTGQAAALGEEVNVTLRQSSGLSAVGWAYVLPLAVLLVILVFLQWLPLADLYSGAAAVGGVALYYGALYGFRKKWKKKYIFEIEKIE